MVLKMDRMTQIKVVKLRKKWGFDCYTPINLLQTVIDKIDNLTWEYKRINREIEVRRQNSESFLKTALGI